MESEIRIDYKIATYTYKTFTTLFLLIGTITNILSAIVYSRKKMRKTSYSVYLFALAIVDLCVTVNGNTRIFFMAFDFNFLKTPQTEIQKSFDSYSNQQIFKGIDIRETSLAACRIHRFLTYYFLQLSSIILCLLSIDRFFGCVLVLKSSRFCKPSIARKTIFIILCLLLVFNSHFLVMGFEQTVSKNDSDNSTVTIIQCFEDKSSKYATFWSIYFYADSLVYCIIPFIIMITCNISIIAKIISSRIRSKQVIIAKNKKSNQNYIAKNSRSMLATEKRISIILIMISLSFLFLTIPVFIMENLINESAFKNPKFEIALAISYMLMYANHVINFFFYCSLGPSFRKEVKKLLPKCFFGNKIDPVKVSRSHFEASTSANPKKFISRGDISTFNKTTTANVPKQTRLVVVVNQESSIKREVSSGKNELELKILLSDRNDKNEPIENPIGPSEEQSLI